MAKKMKPMYAHFTVDVIVPLDPGDPLGMAAKVNAINDELRAIKVGDLYAGGVFHVGCQLKRSVKNFPAPKSEPLAGPPLPLE